MINPQQLNSGVFPNWCPGCGDFSMFAGLKNALVKLDMPIEKHMICYGIGCHGHMVNFMKAYGFEGLHGRPLTVAEGVKLANKDLNVMVIAGDGDTYGEGMAHFMHVMRRNIDMTLIVHDNMVYGLTIGKDRQQQAADSNQNQHQKEQSITQ